MAESNKNPAAADETMQERRERVPMSVPQQKLAVPEIPGFHLHWMRGDPARLQQALRAGYTFVEDDEIDLVNLGVADSELESGNTDLGSRISVLASSSPNELGNAERLYLMKLPEEYWRQDQALLEERSETFASAMREGRQVGTAQENRELSYTPQQHIPEMRKNLFTRKRRT